MISATAGKIVNLGLYQLGWLCCVLGAAWVYPLRGAVAALLLMAVHLLLATSRQAELKLMLCACLLGTVVDSAQQALGVFSFKTDPAWPFWLPLWVLVIWAQFATLLHYGLHWLTGRPLLAAGFGLVGGPLAYWGGISLGAANFGDNLGFSYASLALLWALVMPLLVWLSHRFDGREGRYRWPGGKLLQR
ncbi:Protein of unknown function [Geoalkalibacter ferrihydriticus]|uniref:DUF2878 domain-containing protein n=1 Tax=Geoalkalibacter ferrihydriticus TaxID=392333 RepID=A0A1G9PSM2_9BACT|nr:DUF2878 domain-containing protein [Geoalkalibacter ferrihydriticus]SDM01125.1 Protein of unknown function [Geoalkalibacter ferrihydriticus]